MDLNKRALNAHITGNYSADQESRDEHDGRCECDGQAHVQISGPDRCDNEAMVKCPKCGRWCCLPCVFAGASTDLASGKTVFWDLQHCHACSEAMLNDIPVQIRDEMERVLRHALGVSQLDADENE